MLWELARLASPSGGDDVAAAGALAWLLLPGACATAHRLRSLTPRIDEVVAAQLWLEVREFAWQRLGKVAANIVMNVRRGVLRELGVGSHLGGGRPGVVACGALASRGAPVGSPRRHPGPRSPGPGRGTGRGPRPGGLPAGDRRARPRPADQPRVRGGRRHRPGRPGAGRALLARGLAGGCGRARGLGADDASPGPQRHARPCKPSVRRSRPDPWPPGDAGLAFGGEVMNVTDEPDLDRLLLEAGDEASAVADLESCVGRLVRSRAAQTRLAVLPAEQLRAALGPAPRAARGRPGMTGVVSAPPRPVAVDELRRAWHAIQDGQFRARPGARPVQRRLASPHWRAGRACDPGRRVPASGRSHDDGARDRHGLRARAGDRVLLGNLLGPRGRRRSRSSV